MKKRALIIILAIFVIIGVSWGNGYSHGFNQRSSSNEITENEIQEIFKSRLMQEYGYQHAYLEIPVLVENNFSGELIRVADRTGVYYKVEDLIWPEKDSKDSGSIGGYMIVFEDHPFDAYFLGDAGRDGKVDRIGIVFGFAIVLSRKLPATNFEAGVALNSFSIRSFERPGSDKDDLYDMFIEADLILTQLNNIS